MEERICADGAFVTVVENVVQLIFLRAGQRVVNDVFSLDTHGRDEYIPKLNWLTPQTLVISVPNTSLVGLHKKQVDGVTIAIEFQPNDPEGRRIFLRSLGIDRQ